MQYVLCPIPVLPMLIVLHSLVGLLYGKALTVPELIVAGGLYHYFSFFPEVASGLLGGSFLLPHMVGYPGVPTHRNICLGRRLFCYCGGPGQVVTAV